MSIIYNGTTLKEVIYNGVNLEKVIYNGVTVFNRWTYKTGNLVAMTSNSYNGFTASHAGWDSANTGAAYTAFDGSTSTVHHTNNPNETASNQPTNPHVKLMFPKPIRIAEIQSWIGYGSYAVDYSRWFSIYGIKEDGTEVLLATNNSGDTWGNANNSKQTHTVSTVNQQIPFVGIVAHRTSGGNGWYRLWDIQITKWYE